MATEESSDGLLYSKNLKVGYDELSWLQAETGDNGDIARRERRARAMTTGLVPDFRHGSLAGRVWRVIDSTTTIGISIPSALGFKGPTHIAFIDEDGYYVPLEASVGLGTAIPKWVANGDLTVPNDSTWYTVVVSRDTTQYERGTLGVTTASATVTGTSTDFGRHNGKTDAGYNRGTKVRIDAADTTQGNSGTFEIDTIASDTSLALTAAVPGSNESGIPFTIAGNWLTSPPADTDIHQRSIPKFELIARTRQPPAGKIILCDVMRDDAATVKVGIIDRRFQWYRPLPAMPMGATILPKLVYDTASPFTAVTLNRISMFTPSTNAISAGIAPYGKDGLMVAVDDGTVIKHLRFLYDSGSWSTVGTIEAGPASHPTLVEFPRTNEDPILGSGARIPYHAVFYVKSNALKMRTWDNATWSAETAVWTPATFSGTHTLDDPHAFLAADHRLWIVARYYDGSVYRLRYVYSDDYGSTWTINGHNGFACGTTEASYRPRIGQSPDRNLFVTYDNNAGVVRMFATESETALAVGSGIVKAISPSSSGTYTGPAPMWFGIGGEPLVVCSEEISTRSNVYLLRPNWDTFFAAAAFGDQASERLWTMASTTLGPLWIDLCVGRAGGVHVITTDETAAPDGLVHVPCFAQEFHAPKPHGLLY